MTSTIIKKQLLTILFLSFAAVTCLAQNTPKTTPSIIESTSKVIPAQGSLTTTNQASEEKLTIGNYVDFLNAVAWKEDVYHLYPFDENAEPSEQPITCVLNDNNTYSYGVAPGMENLAITTISLNSAKRFCNWKENGSLTANDSLLPDEITEKGAYLFTQLLDGQEIVQANPNAHYQISNEEESLKKINDPSLSDTFNGFQITSTNTKVVSPISTPFQRVPSDKSSPQPPLSKAEDHPSDANSKSFLSSHKDLLVKATVAAGIMFVGTSALFITGEIAINYFGCGMTMQAIGETFSIGRIISTVSHLSLNSFLAGLATVKASQK